MDGLLIIDKPQGMTSHDVVARARRMLREKRIGHAGTLDPMATGVLVLCVGQATRLSEYLLGEDKTYDGLIKLGERTNTDDAEGEVIAARPVPPISSDVLHALEQQYSGEISQVPPQFSAIQKGGQRAYALARKGETVELDARTVTVHELRLALVDGQSAMIQAHVHCVAGTYIRSLARDMGEALGCGGHLVALRRTQAGQFTLADAVTLEQVEQAAKDGHAAPVLLPMERAVADWPEVTLDDEQTRRVRNGMRIVPPTGAAFESEALCRVYDSRRAFIAVARWDGTTLAPVKVFDAASSLVQ